MGGEGLLTRGFKSLSRRTIPYRLGLQEKKTQIKNGLPTTLFIGAWQVPSRGTVGLIFFL